MSYMWHIDYKSIMYVIAHTCNIHTCTSKINQSMSINIRMREGHSHKWYILVMHALIRHTEDSCTSSIAKLVWGWHSSTATTKLDQTGTLWSNHIAREVNCRDVLTSRVFVLWLTKTLEVKTTTYCNLPPLYYMIAQQCPHLILSVALWVTIADVLDHNLSAYTYQCMYHATVGHCRTSWNNTVQLKWPLKNTRGP